MAGDVGGVGAGAARPALVRWHDETLRLRPDGSVFWPRESTLFVADLHLGKGAAFRARGVPVPSGDTLEDLARLERALAATEARRVVVLGDLFHGRESRTDHVEEGLARWRRARPRVELLLVRGNHDRHAGDPDPALGVRVEAEPLPLGPFVLWHHPPGRRRSGPVPSEPGARGDPSGSSGRGAAGAGPALAGHLHPVAVLRGPADGARLPCFWVRPWALVLPAWGTFTGGHPVRVGSRDRVFVLVDGGVTEVPVG